MMANVTYINPQHEHALLYSVPSQPVLDYLSRGFQHLQTKLQDISSSFVDGVRSIYDRYNSNAAIEDAKRFLAEQSLVLNPEAIHYVPYDKFELATPTMQAYIMAYPELNMMNKRNLCSAFNGLYFDREPNTYGKDRVDYMQVMDGVLQFDDEGDGYITHYSFEQDDLLTAEKYAILDTWDNVARHLANSDDPTDV